MAATPAAGREQPGPASYQKFFHAAPVALLVIRADGLVIVDANPPYLDQVQLTLDELTGRHVFDVFPESPRNDDDQAGELEHLMRTTIADRRPVSINGLRYDIVIGDQFEVRWWNVVEVPVLDDAGQVEFLVHFSEDVTELHETRGALETAQRAQLRAAKLATTQAELAVALTGAQNLADLQRLAFSSLRDELGADAASVVSRADDGGWLVTLNEGVGNDFRAAYTTLAFDSDLPVVIAARLGARILIPDLETGIEMSAAVAESTPRVVASPGPACH